MDVKIQDLLKEKSELQKKIDKDHIVMKEL